MLSDNKTSPEEAKQLKMLLQMADKRLGFFLLESADVSISNLVFQLLFRDSHICPQALAPSLLLVKLCMKSCINKTKYDGQVQVLFLECFAEFSYWWKSVVK